MIPSAAAQHRGKHFDLLLTREIAAIEREHEQNLITYQKLKNSILRDIRKTKNYQKRSPIPTPTDESSNEQTEKSSTIISSTIHSYTSTYEPTPKIYRKYYRHCYKGQRLPPIVKRNRKKQKTNELNWITNFRPISITNENVDDASSVLTDELPKIPSPELSPIQKRIHTFMEILPEYKGAAKGFDNFAPTSLYSRRAVISIR